MESTPDQTANFSAEHERTAECLDISDSKRYCWVCFASEDDDLSATWVRPCRCKGTTKWVHQTCLQRWVDEKQKGNSLAKVSCPQCNTQYIVMFPPIGPIVYVMNVADRIVYHVCPLVAAGILVGSIYWTAVTYGAVTVMQVFGPKEGLSMMEQADPLFLLVGLPTIPILLILGKMVPWEDYIVRLWLHHSPRIPLVKYLAAQRHIRPLMFTQPPTFSDPVSATRVLCGALLLPTVATCCGKLFFDTVQSNWQRTLLGGAAFIAIKGILKMYYRHQQYLRQVQRQILDFHDNVSTATTTATSESQTENSQQEVR